MSDLKDHIWSVAAGAGTGAGALGTGLGSLTGILAIDGSKAAADVAAATDVAAAAFVVTAASAITLFAATSSAVGNKINEFKTPSAFGAVAFSLAASFIAADQLQLLDILKTETQTMQQNASIQITSEKHYSDAAQAFNETNADGNAVEASVDGQGHYVLTVNAPKPAL